MALYQIIPYSVTVSVTNLPDELKPLDNLDGTGLSLVSAVAAAASAHRGRELRSKPDVDRSIKITDIRKNETTLALEVQSGSQGITGNLSRTRGGKQDDVDIKPADTTLVPLRHILATAPGSTRGILLAEKAGNHGVITDLSAMLKHSIGSKLSGLKLNITPAMSDEGMKKWAETAKIKGIIVRRTTPNGDVLGEKGLPSFRVVPPRRRAWLLDALGGLGKADPKRVMEEVVPLMPRGLSSEGVAEAAQQLLDEGWTVALDLRGKSGRQRTVDVTSKAGVSLTFPAGSETGRAEPTEFATQVMTVLKELEDLKMAAPGLAQAHTMPDTAWQDDLKWKGDWGVDASPVPPASS